MADKSNITIAITKEDYQKKLNYLMKDVHTYQKVNLIQ